MERLLLGILVLSDGVIFFTCLRLQPVYHFVNQSLSWTEAQTYCRQTHTDLATFLSSDEQNLFINTLSSAGHTSDVWIGLFSEIDWRWSDGLTGSGADYRHWKTSSSEPSFDQPDELCVSFHYDGGWITERCPYGRYFLCYKGSHANPEFVFGKEPLSWSDAQTYCRKNFIDLAIFKNDTDYQKIQVSTLGGYRHWIGLFRDPNLHWSDGSGVNFTSWDSAPTMIGSMPVICGVTSSGKSGRWKFLPCETRLPFVCFDRPGKKQVVKMRLHTDNSVDLNDPVLRGIILTKLQNRLQETGVSVVTLSWRNQPDGNVFKKEKKT
ncbi:secretory phospholipase A2 receptor-like [Poecilia latipinna]|uniref:secretory phospholipase A2 receptor-like n=1 Tax=Poecilia formosa TaxID=48698 RepID=UPI000443A60D|nr:PREDICTED: secretory phospholipase A2 receptor-like [Poecilia formosa]XP_014834659.1 PREDICTED: secretory phospholipase A2 receptor-like [Poecilia mexicana]XP_014880844.1 PREDICTED: secretory phospholipase A2 receptor-like [Poecilia latipinna]